MILFFKLEYREIKLSQVTIHHGSSPESPVPVVHPAEDGAAVGDLGQRGLLGLGAGPHADGPPRPRPGDLRPPASTSQCTSSLVQVDISTVASIFALKSFGGLTGALGTSLLLGTLRPSREILALAATLVGAQILATRA